MYAPMAPVTEEFLARYPFTEAAKRYVAARSIRLDELDPGRYRPEIGRAFERVREALRRGRVSAYGSDQAREVEVVSFPIALALVAAAGDGWLARRWALAEALRSGRFLEEEDEETVAGLLAELGVRVERAPREREHLGPLTVPVAQYLELACRIDGPEWRLVNRHLVYGAVHLAPRDLARLAVEAIQRRILERVGEAEGLPMPDHLAELARRLRLELAQRRRYDESVYQVSEAFWPPCMAKIKGELLAGQPVGHFANFALAAFMLNAGYNTEQVMAMYAQRSDFNEKIARYQVEHIAGQRGSRVKYTPPSCETMRTYGLCVEEGRLCPRIKNPIQYYRRAARREARERGGRRASEGGEKGSGGGESG
jgi:DNA primase large subunit